jgi:TIR domain-containing protein
LTKVFLSWSGKRSEALARELYHWLPRVLHTLIPWMSTHDIQSGRHWSLELGRSLAGHNVGILCVTPENYLAPWLIFEAGALSRSLAKGKVIPLLFGMALGSLEGPLSQFQAATLERDQVFRLLASLNSESKNPVSSDVLKDTFEKFWPELELAVKAIAKQLVPGDDETVHNILKVLAHHNIARPLTGSIYFDSGYESHALYSSLTEVAEQRLLIFGRKNRKLFDKDHVSFVSKLKDRIGSGFDFRIMFLDPEAPPEVLRCAHRDNDIADQIRGCMTRARSALTEAGIDFARHCRTYNIHRTVSFVVVDSAVLYSPITLDEDGYARPLTKVPFTLANASRTFGRDLIASFDRLWDKTS